MTDRPGPRQLQIDGRALRSVRCVLHIVHDAQQQPLRIASNRFAVRAAFSTVQGEVLTAVIKRPSARHRRYFFGSVTCTEMLCSTSKSSRLNSHTRREQSNHSSGSCDFILRATTGGGCGDLTECPGCRPHSTSTRVLQKQICMLLPKYARSSCSEGCRDGRTVVADVFVEVIVHREIRGVNNLAQYLLRSGVRADSQKEGAALLSNRAVASCWTRGIAHRR